MIATDAMVTALANSKRFQYLALRIDGFINSKHNMVAMKAEDVVKKGEQMMKDPNLKIKAEQAARDFTKQAQQSTAARFFTALKQEIQKDLGGGKK